MEKARSGKITISMINPNIWNFINSWPAQPFILSGIESIVVKGQNAGFLQCFQKLPFSGMLKVEIV